MIRTVNKTPQLIAYLFQLTPSNKRKSSIGSQGLMFVICSPRGRFRRAQKFAQLFAQMAVPQLTVANGK